MSKNGATTLVRFTQAQQEQINNLKIPPYVFVRLKMGQCTEKDFEKYPQLKEMNIKSENEGVQVQMRPEGVSNADYYVKFLLAEEEKKRLAEKLEEIDQNSKNQLHGLQGQFQEMMERENKARELKELQARVEKLEAKKKKQKAVIESLEQELEEMREQVSVKGYITDVGPAVINGLAHKFEAPAKAMAEGLAGILTGGAYSAKSPMHSEEDRKSLEVINHLKAAIPSEDLQKVYNLITLFIGAPEMISLVEAFLQNWKNSQNQFSDPGNDQQ